MFLKCTVFVSTHTSKSIFNTCNISSPSWLYIKYIIYSLLTVELTLFHNIPQTNGKWCHCKCHSNISSNQNQKDWAVMVYSDFHQCFISYSSYSNEMICIRIKSGLIKFQSSRVCAQNLINFPSFCNLWKQWLSGREIPVSFDNHKWIRIQ